MLNRTLKFALPAALAMLLTACGQEAEKKSAKTLYLEGYQQLTAPTAQYNFNADIKLDGSQFEAMLADVKLSLNGAVDMAGKKFEVTPEVKAAMFQIRLPISLDLKQEHIIIDPVDIISAMQMFQPDAAGVVERYKNKFIRLKKSNLELDEEQQQELDTALDAAGQIFEIAFDVAEKASQDLPESSFQLKELGESGKQSDVSTAISLVLSAEQRQEFERAILVQFRERLQASTVADEIKQQILAGLEEAETMDRPEEAVDSVVYLNAKGQVVRVNDRYTYLIEGKQAFMDVNVAFSQYGQAKFSIAPVATDIIDIDEEEIATVQMLMGK